MYHFHGQHPLSPGQAAHWQRWRRGPSRFVWFTFGAITTVCWIKHKEMHEQERYRNHCVRAPIQVPQNLAPPPPPVDQYPQQSSSVHGYSPAKPSPWAWGQNDYDQQFEQDKQRLIALRQQAQNTFSELSESTLDSLLSTVEGLKAKLAERREQHNQAENTNKAGTQKDQPPHRWV